mgnify:CR=1 FL=1
MKLNKIAKTLQVYKTKYKTQRDYYSKSDLDWTKYLNNVFKKRKNLHKTSKF